MSKLSYDEAKQKVAEKFGFKSWYAFKKANKPGYGPSPTNPAVHLPEQIVAVTMAQNWANEAVREDRGNPESFYTTYMSTELSISQWDLQNRPLPYPEIEK